ncbi:hypothetical protein ACFFGH_17355 [Lysobacter korlensis]|uniref:Uncharacterized protein n=1 Tax=Lysobacter korlensis TaxID=553636 RepID=A0ABV6RRL0_9GAMM
MLITLALSAFSSTALAQSVQLKGGAVSIGDSVDSLLKVAGKPDQVRPFPGSPSFTLYEYSTGDRHVNVSVKDGKVTGIADGTLVSMPTPARWTGVELHGTRIVIGDSLAKLLGAAGEPASIRSFADMPGLSVYEYSLEGREVTVSITDGKVSGTSETKAVKK